MGRPPCCDKIGVKKGPWTPEEDIILVTYIQEHGPGNWRAVPASTGLMRCSKSCRLRWTNYLRPGIKRGNFTQQEEKLIIHLQALLGNRWAAIASYLPERTDNDVKNYWNTHLKKKLSKLQTSPATAVDNNSPANSSSSSSKGRWERTLQTDIQKAKLALRQALSFDHHKEEDNNSSQSSSINDLKPSVTSSTSNNSLTYAANTENISRLLENWMKETPKTETETEAESESSMANNMNIFTKYDGVIMAPSEFCGLMTSSSACSTPPEMSDHLHLHGQQQQHFSVLERWLLDDFMVQDEIGVDGTMSF